MLSRRSTVLIWHVDRVGRLDVRLACPASGQRESVSDYGRRIDVMQQLAALGLHEAVTRVAEPLTETGAADPLASVIVTAAHGGRSTHERMWPNWQGRITRDPALAADEQAFLAAELDTMNRGLEARSLFRQLGSYQSFPVTAEATRLLLAGLRRHLLAPEHAARLERSVRTQMLGSFWAAVWNDAGAELGGPLAPFAWTLPTRAPATARPRLSAKTASSTAPVT